MEKKHSTHLANWRSVADGGEHVSAVGATHGSERLQSGPSLQAQQLASPLFTNNVICPQLSNLNLDAKVQTGLSIKTN